METVRSSCWVCVLEPIRIMLIRRSTNGSSPSFSAQISRCDSVANCACIAPKVRNAPDGVLLLASFDAREDPENHDIMRRNRRRLEAFGRWHLLDLPTAPPHSDGIIRTWNNVLPFNGVLFVPQFDHAPSERLLQAWRQLGAAFPGRTLRPIPSEVLLEFGGAVHCIARGEPYDDSALQRSSLR